MRKGQFTPGNKFSVGYGRPKKHEVLKQLQKMRDDVNMLPDAVLEAIAHKQPDVLESMQIPLSQITDQLQVIASGYLYFRERLNRE